MKNKRFFQWASLVWSFISGRACGCCSSLRNFFNQTKLRKQNHFSTNEKSRKYLFSKSRISYKSITPGCPSLRHYRSEVIGCHYHDDVALLASSNNGDFVLSNWLSGNHVAWLGIAMGILVTVLSMPVDWQARGWTGEVMTVLPVVTSAFGPEVQKIALRWNVDHAKEISVRKIAGHRALQALNWVYDGPLMVCSPATDCSADIRDAEMISVRLNPLSCPRRLWECLSLEWAPSPPTTALLDPSKQPPLPSKASSTLFSKYQNCLWCARSQ